MSMIEYPHGKLWAGCCFELMKDLPDHSIDLILTDIPYGNEVRVPTGNGWDKALFDRKKMFEEFKRIIKPQRAIVMTANNPLFSMLICENIDWYRYDWVWAKRTHCNFISARHQPLRDHEYIIVFGKGNTTFSKTGKYLIYNPQMTEGKPYSQKSFLIKSQSIIRKKCTVISPEYKNKTSRFPGTILEFTTNEKDKGLHNTQKPRSLFEYLIRTYSNEGDTVLDICGGSGTTAVSAMKTKRNWIVCEKDPRFIEVIKDRIAREEDSEDNMILF